MSELREYNFNSVYDLANIIDQAVTHEVELFNHNEDYFLESSTKFRQDTILHQYIVCELLNHFRREFWENGDLMEEDIMEEWYELFSSNNIEIEEFNFIDEDGEENEEHDIYNWFNDNRKKFYDLFDKLGEEIFHILFSNRGFLLRFNNLIAKTVEEFDYPGGYLNKKGRIKRAHIPTWAKRAVFHRDKGRCVFCNTDLTGILNSFTNVNYDHIVPLDRFGINDPSNLQLCCESCNKSKTNKEGETSNKYFSWWKRIKPRKKKDE